MDDPPRTINTWLPVSHHGPARRCPYHLVTGVNVTSTTTRPSRAKTFLTPRNSLPPEYQEALADAKPGDIVGPFPVESPVGKRFVVVVFELARNEGEMALDELRDQIRSRLAEQRAMTKYLDQLKSQTYVDIRL